MRKKRARMVETAWGKVPLVRKKCGMLAKAVLVCADCLKSRKTVYLTHGCGGMYSYVVNPTSGKYVANLRDQEFVCGKCLAKNNAR